MQFALSQDEQGNPVVVMEEDILDGVTIGNEKILITKKSRKEITNSGDTGWLRKNQPDVYADKMRSSANADEILMATTDKKNEPPDHHRKDDIVSFDAGNVQISVGGKIYNAEVMIGNKSNGKKLLYDFVRMTKKEEMQPTVGRQGAPHGSLAASLSDNSVAQSVYPVNSHSMQDGKKKTRLTVSGTTIRSRLRSRWRTWRMEGYRKKTLFLLEEPLKSSGKSDYPTFR